MSRDHIQDYWGKALSVWSPTVVAKTDVSEAVKDFLVTIGLPTGRDWLFGLEPPAKCPETCGGLLVIGRDDSIPLVVDETGQVLAVEGPNRTRFVNSSLDAFVSSLAAYDTYRRVARGMDEEEVATLVDQIEEKLQQADSASLNRENYWAVIVEQMREGLL